MSARIVVDFGEQLVQDKKGCVYMQYRLLLSCGCRVEVDKRAILLLPRVSDFARLCEELAKTHECEPKMLRAPPLELNP